MITFIRRSLPVFGLFCCICGCFAVVLPTPPLAHSYKPFQVDNDFGGSAADERLHIVEQRLIDMKDYGDRLIRLEMNSEHHTEQLDQILWLGRWMGIALLAAVFDKVLGVIGLGSVSDRVKKRIERNSTE